MDKVLRIIIQLNTNQQMLRKFKIKEMKILKMKIAVYQIWTAPGWRKDPDQNFFYWNVTRNAKIS